MTPTMFDVFALLGLRPMGALAHHLMAVGTSPDDDILNGVPLSYNDFIKHVKGAGASPFLTRRNAVLICSRYVGS